MMFKDVLTFLGLDYRGASLITLYFVVIGFIIQQIQHEKFEIHKSILKCLN